MEGHVETRWMKGRKGADRFQPWASTKGKGEISTSNLDASRRALYATDISLQIVNFDRVQGRFGCVHDLAHRLTNLLPTYKTRRFLSRTEGPAGPLDSRPALPPTPTV